MDCLICRMTNENIAYGVSFDEINPNNSYCKQCNEKIMKFIKEIDEKYYEDFIERKIEKQHEDKQIKKNS